MSEQQKYRTAGKTKLKTNVSFSLLLIIIIIFFNTFLLFLYIAIVDVVVAVVHNLEKAKTFRLIAS